MTKKLHKAAGRAVAAATVDTGAPSGTSGFIIDNELGKYQIELVTLDSLPKVTRFQEGRESVLTRHPEWPKWEQKLEKGLPENQALKIPVIGNRPLGRMAAMVRHYLRRRKLPYRVMATRKEPGSVFVIRLNAKQAARQREFNLQAEGEFTPNAAGTTTATATTVTPSTPSTRAKRGENNQHN